MSGFVSPNWSSGVFICGGVALLFTGLNALKPLNIDDTAYYYYARQIAQHPDDPYGGGIFWYQHPMHANHVLAPPVLPYWWSLALRFFGERPVLWKLWLLPFSLLFVGSFFMLARRFARGLELPLTIMTVLSPAFLPSFNLMLDVPALSLSLFAITLFLRACSAGPSFPASRALRYSSLLLAGLAAGMAMQTKYTGALAPAVILLYGVLFGYFRHGLVAAAIAAGVFAGWESWIAWTYGESHFLYHFQDNEEPLEHKFRLILPLIAILGGVAGGVFLLGLAAVSASRRVLWGAILATLIGYGLLAFVPEDAAVFLHDPVNHQNRFTLNNLVFGSLGILTIGMLGLTAYHLLSKVYRYARTNLALRTSDKEVCFLVLWLALEVAGYFALTPFPAARRVLGLVVVSTLLIGRLASRTLRTGSRRQLAWTVAGFNVVLGLLYFGVDLRDAGAAKEAVERAAGWIERQTPAEGQVWYVGHWGIQYYAERAGMKPVVPKISLLRRGDWLVVPDSRLEQQTIAINATRSVLAHELQVEDQLPLRTVRCYYGGNTPLEHHEGPRVRVLIYQVQADFVPPSRAH